jgi:hypothetical protein
MNKCIIWSNSSNGREYAVNTKSAYKAALTYGRCESGEVVQIRAMRSGKVISEVRWTPEDGGKYYRTVPAEQKQPVTAQH